MADRRDVLGVGFDDVTMEEALERIAAMVEGKARGYVVTPNAEIVYTARTDGELSALVKGAALVVPDGVGVMHAARILGRPLRARVPGVDLGWKLAGICAARGWRLFLLGAKPGVAEEAARRMQETYPGLVIAGTQDGYFKDESAVVEALRAEAPDVVFVCLGSPRQERFMGKYIDKLPPAVMLGLGGSMDIYAGSVKRAPVAFQKLGLEWFYRLCSEPRLRARRMAKLPAFLCIAVGERLRKEQ